MRYSTFRQRAQEAAIKKSQEAPRIAAQAEARYQSIKADFEAGLPVSATALQLALHYARRFHPDDAALWS